MTTLHDYAAVYVRLSDGSPAYLDQLRWAINGLEKHAGRSLAITDLTEAIVNDYLAATRWHRRHARAVATCFCDSGDTQRRIPHWLKNREHRTATRLARSAGVKSLRVAGRRLTFSRCCPWPIR